MDPSSMGDMMNQWEIQSYQRDQGAKNQRFCCGMVPISMVKFRKKFRPSFSLQFGHSSGENLGAIMLTPHDCNSIHDKNKK
jgi:hypothetical protein